MLKAKLKLDTDKMVITATDKIEANIADSEIMETLTEEQKINLNAIIYDSLVIALEDFNEFDLVAI